MRQYIPAVLLLLILAAAGNLAMGRLLPRGVLAAAAIQGVASATTSSSGTSSSPSFVDALQQMQLEQQSLVSEVADLRSRLEVANLKAIFTRTLKRGDSGNDVKELQTLIGQIFPTASSTITGFYGHATADAVSNFQMQAGLRQTGVFDRGTRTSLLQAITALATSTGADVAPVDLSSITDPQQGIQDLQDQVTQLSSELSDTQATLSGVQNQVSDLATAVTDLQASMPAPASPGGGSSVQPLALANIQVGSISKTSAVITWTTNNPATSEVDYSSNPSFPVSQTFVMTNTTLTTSHRISLSGLMSGTTYYYRVISKDAGGTTANSSNLVFSTLH